MQSKIAQSVFFRSVLGRRATAFGAEGTRRIHGTRPANVGERRGVRRGTRRSLGAKVAAGESPRLCWSDLDLGHLNLVFRRRLGRDRDRSGCPPASYLGFCRHARSPLRTAIVSTVTGLATERSTPVCSGSKQSGKTIRKHR